MSDSPARLSQTKNNLPLLTKQRILTGFVLCVLLSAVVITSLVPVLDKHLQDLDVYRLGGWAVLRGQPLYAQRTGQYGFTYPPFAAVLAASFAVVPYGAASAALTVGSLTSLVRLGTAWVGAIRDRIRRRRDPDGMLAR